MRRYSFVAVLLLAVPGIPLSSLGLALERSPYLQLSTPTSIVVRWRTDVNSDSVVKYGPAPDDLSMTEEATGARTEHEILITGLTADTRYYYSVGATGDVLAGGDGTHFFETAPAVGSTDQHRIWFFSDSHYCSLGFQNSRDSVLNFTSGHKPDLVITGGDNAGAAGSENEYTALFFPEVAGVLRNTVIWTSMGNHDCGDSNPVDQTGPYFDSFTLPKAAEAGGVASNTEAYYSFDYGNIHFVVLDIYCSPRGPEDPMYAWLTSDLAANDQDWTIVYGHIPTYSRGRRDSDTDAFMVSMREIFVPLLESYGIDLVLSGHNHSYERSMLINGHHGVASTFTSSHIIQSGMGEAPPYTKLGAGPVANSGAVYIVAGSATSVKPYSGTFDHPVMVAHFEQESDAVNLGEQGSVVIDVQGSTMDVHWIQQDGRARDHFQIRKVADDVRVPALSSWGKLALAAVFLSLGLATITAGRRSRAARGH